MFRRQSVKVERLNPSLKAGTILVSVILLSFQYLVSLNLLVFIVCMLLLVFFSDAAPRRIITILIPALIAAFGLFMMGLYYARGSSVTDVRLENISAVPYAIRAAMSQNLYTAMQLSTRLLAYAGMGILFALTTDGEYFIASLMHQCALSPKFAYGLLAAFHLMPVMVREYRNVRIAFAVRGIPAHPLSLKPMFTMLVNSIRWSESAAMAMESKGFCAKAPRTYAFIPRVHWYDWFCSILCIAGIITGMMLFEV